MYDGLINELDQQITRLTEARNILAGKSPAYVNGKIEDIGEHKRKRKKMSAEAKHRISLGQKKR